MLFFSFRSFRWVDCVDHSDHPTMKSSVLLGRLLGHGVTVHVVSLAVPLVFRATSTVCVLSSLGDARFSKGFPCVFFYEETESL